MMRQPFSLPQPFPDRGLASVGWRLIVGLVTLLLTALRVLLVTVLRLLRPFITLPLLALAVAGICAAGVFAYRHEWLDAAEAGFVAIVGAVLLVSYSLAVLWLDPDHFEPRPTTRWVWYP